MPRPGAMETILDPAERQAYLKLVASEIEGGVPGEIDEAALREKRVLFSSRGSARSPARLDLYAQASFGGTVAGVHPLLVA